MDSNTPTSAGSTNLTSLPEEPCKLERYYYRAEDDPYIAMGWAEDFASAAGMVHKLVQDRLIANGCGDGLVYDTWTDTIVLVLGYVGSKMIEGTEVPVVGAMPLPSGVDLEEIKNIIRSNDLQSIWPTLAW